MVEKTSYEELEKECLRLKEIEARYISLINTISDGIFNVDLTGTLLFVNPALAGIHGFATTEEMLGRKVFELIHPDEKQEIRELFDHIIHTGQVPENIEVAILSEDGSTKRIMVRPMAVYENGQITSLKGTVKDITESRQVEKLKLQNSRKFNALADTLPQIVFEMDEKRQLTYVNRQAFNLTGYTEKDLAVSVNVFEFIAPEDRQRAAQNLQRVMNGEKLPGGNEYTIIKKDGSTMPATIFSSQRIENGVHAGYQGIIVDITERRQMEETLRQSKARLTSCIESLPFDFFAMDSDGRYVMQNLLSQKRWGTVIGRKLEDIELDPAIRAIFASNNRRAFAGEIVQSEEEFHFRDRKEYVFNIISPISDGEEITGILGVNIDITDRKQAEKQLQQAERKLQTIFEESPVSLWVEDVSEILAYFEELRSNGVADFAAYFNDHPEAVHTCLEKLRVLDVNRATVKMYGATCKEDLLNNLTRIFTKESMKAFKAWFVALAEGLTEVDVETQARKLSGERIYNTIKWNLVKGRDDAHILLVTVTDISKRRQVELALLKSEQRYRTLFENASDIIQILSPEGRLLYVNPTWLKTFDYSRDEVAAMKVFDFIHPDCAGICSNNFNLVLTEGKVENVEITFMAKDGRKVIVEGNVNCHMEDGRPQYVQCIFHDVTDRKKMEAELHKAHKLESIGILAGGIAHDFNNILTAVIGNISLARFYSKPGDKIYEKLGNAERATLRAKDLTQQLLTFSKGGEPIKRSIDIQQLVREASSFVLRGSNVKCSCNLADDLWAVEADEGQLSQVIHNLVINADQAMPEGGQITITAQNRVIAADDDYLPLQEGSYVVVTIKDHGIGIKTEHLNRVFDPYFSTKQKGHGLGLATAYSIVKNHGGLLTVNSTIGRGSTFTMYIPAAQKNAVQETAEHEGLHQGKGYVLLMDDEEDVRNVASEMLTCIGYKVTTAAEGRESLALYEKARQAGKPYDAVIMDLTIPGGLGGKETISELLAIDPEVKAIVSSGYANDPIMANYREYGFAGVVPKPYKIEQLSNVLKKLVN